ncbi:MAG: hypothetical protein BWY78_00536 [Alphaproteobacteria bacterium ADurb.Bin438]|nr:MAG: hypothetical protein BWY78_00536 [Alphaproteobacteria bacterium ADurb.Bin438]
MGQKPKIQNDFFKNYWVKIEENTNKNVTDFLRNYLIYKKGIIPNKSDVYKVFKNYVIISYNTDEYEELLKDLLRVSKFYYYIITQKHDDNNISLALKSIDRLKITVSYPFIFKLFYNNEEGLISNSELFYCLKIIETYSIRRFVCDLPSNALNKIYANLSKEIERIDGYQNDYVDAFKRVLLSGTLSKKFPDDFTFIRKFKEKDIYNSKLYRLYILECLENYDNKEMLDLEKLIEDGSLTIEHIMPQTLTKEWKDELGDNWLEVHSKYLNTIGNLTLTGYNSKYSNKSFKDKVNIEKGFRESRLKLNRYISEQTFWNEYNINKRSEILSDIASKVWSGISSKNEIIKPQTEYIYLSDDIDVTGTKPMEMIFMGDRYKISNWAEALVKVSENLYNVDPSKLISDAYDEGSKYCSISDSNLRSPKKVADDFFVETNYSAQNIVKNISLILKKYEIEDDELGFLIK